jgi:hypothetical protein
MHAVAQERGIMARSQKEHQAQCALFQWANANRQKYPCLAEGLRAIPNGGARSAATGAMLKREGVKRGTFDVMLMVPKGIFHGLFIEMKAGNNRLTPEQEGFERHLIDNGYSTCVAYSWIDAAQEIERYLAS